MLCLLLVEEEGVEFVSGRILVVFWINGSLKSLCFLFFFLSLWLMLLVVMVLIGYVVIRLGDVACFRVRRIARRNVYMDVLIR